MRAWWWGRNNGVKVVPKAAYATCSGLDSAHINRVQIRANSTLFVSFPFTVKVWRTEVAI